MGLEYLKKNSIVIVVVMVIPVVHSGMKICLDNLIVVFTKHKFSEDINL